MCPPVSWVMPKSTGGAFRQPPNATCMMCIPTTLPATRPIAGTPMLAAAVPESADGPTLPARRRRFTTASRGKIQSASLVRWTGSDGRPPPRSHFIPCLHCHEVIAGASSVPTGVTPADARPAPAPTIRGAPPRVRRARRRPGARQRREARARRPRRVLPCRARPPSRSRCRGAPARTGSRRRRSLRPRASRAPSASDGAIAGAPASSAASGTANSAARANTAPVTATGDASPTSVAVTRA